MQGTGHGAAPVGPLAGTLLVRTSEMRGLQIDPEHRIARAEAGVLWADVVEAASELGLAPLSGSSPDVGVVGFTLGGGIGWLSRRYGLASERVTGDRGRHRRRAPRAHRPPHRARAVLGAARRRRLVRRGDRDRVRARPADARLRRHDAVAVGARPRGAARLARVDGDGARERHDVRAHHADPGDPRRPRVPARPRRRRDRRRGARRPVLRRAGAGAAACAGAGDRHVRDGAARRALPHPHGPRAPGARPGRPRAARRAAGGGDRPPRRRVRAGLRQPAADASSCATPAARWRGRAAARWARSPPSTSCTRSAP